MGQIKHNAIVVTSWSDEAIQAAAKRAGEIGLTVLGPGPLAINGYRTFIIPPDGSKEAWPDSDCGDERRAEFRAFLREGDGFLGDWLEVQYGPDADRARVVADSDAPDHGAGDPDPLHYDRPGSNEPAPGAD